MRSTAGIRPRDCLSPSRATTSRHDPCISFWHPSRVTTDKPPPRRQHLTHTVSALSLAPTRPTAVEPSLTLSAHISPPAAFPNKFSLQALLRQMPSERVRFTAAHTASAVPAKLKNQTNPTHSSNLHVLRTDAQQLSVGDISPITECVNCLRPLHVNGVPSSICEGSALYCSHNCRWTALLDTSGSRHRRAKRAAAKKGKPKKRRREPLVLNESELTVSHSGAESDDDCIEEANAIFGYYVSTSRRSAFKEGTWDALLLPL